MYVLNVPYDCISLYKTAVLFEMRWHMPYMESWLATKDLRVRRMYYSLNAQHTHTHTRASSKTYHNTSWMYQRFRRSLTIMQKYYSKTLFMWFHCKMTVWCLWSKSEPVSKWYGMWVIAYSPRRLVLLYCLLFSLGVLHTWTGIH